MKAIGLVIFGMIFGALIFTSLPRKQSEPQVKRLIGKGSSFVYPVMVFWSHGFSLTEDGCPVYYDPRGSGSGIKAIIENKVDFACTDGPLNDKELAQAKANAGEVIHVPLVLGAVVPVYNLPEVSEPLRFTGQVLADIYLGKITKWNDKRIQDLNPQAAKALPDKKILAAHRGDGSGTTYIWVDYLSKVSDEWKSKVGFGTEVAWPTGAAERGNEGVADYVQKNAGSIGYVELAFAFRRNLQFGLVENRAKEFVKANLAAMGLAVDQQLDKIPDDLRFSLTDPPGKGAYPICGATWAVVHVQLPPEKKDLLVKFLYWVLDKGQEEADMLFYRRLPEKLRERAEKQLEKLI